MRLSWVIKKGQVHSCHQGKCKCHPQSVMTFNHNEKCDHFGGFSEAAFGSKPFTVLSPVPLLAEVKTKSV